MSTVCVGHFLFEIYTIVGWRWIYGLVTYLMLSLIHLTFDDHFSFLVSPYWICSWPNFWNKTYHLPTLVKDIVSTVSTKSSIDRQMSKILLLKKKKSCCPIKLFLLWLIYFWLTRQNQMAARIQEVNNETINWLGDISVVFQCKKE